MIQMNIDANLRKFKYYILSHAQKKKTYKVKTRGLFLAFLLFDPMYCIPANSHACTLKISMSRWLTLAGQFLTPDWKMWVVAVLLDTISKNMLTQTHVRNENHEKLTMSVQNFPILEL